MLSDVEVRRSVRKLNVSHGVSMTDANILRVFLRYETQQIIRLFFNAESFIINNFLLRT